MDGEVAQLAALVISANHRLANPTDPMAWFATQRAFAACGRISFAAAVPRRFGRPRHVLVAATPAEWLDLLVDSGVKRVVLSFRRQDDGPVCGETLPDRIAAGFAGGGSLWNMATETGNGGALCWRAGWRVAFAGAEDGRIWAAEYRAHPCVSPGADAGWSMGPDIGVASAGLRQALAGIRAFARTHQFQRVAAIFDSAECLAEGRPDPAPVPRPPGPADVLSTPARRLLYSAQRAWIFDNHGLWKDQDFSPELWKRYAALSEALYAAVTAAIGAAVNSSYSKSD